MNNVFHTLPEVFCVGLAPNRVVAHLALHPALVPFASTGHNSFFQDLLEDRLMESSQTPRGE